VKRKSNDYLCFNKADLIRSTANSPEATIALYDEDGFQKYSDAAFYRSLYRKYGTLQGFSAKEWNYLGRRLVRI
jgi:hypothetical protein